MVQAAAGMYCKPEVEFESKRWIVDGKAVLEVIIPKGKKFPYFCADRNRINGWLISGLRTKIFWLQLFI